MFFSSLIYSIVCLALNNFTSSLCTAIFRSFDLFVIHLRCLFDSEFKILKFSHILITIEQFLTVSYFLSKISTDLLLGDIQQVNHRLAKALK